MTVAEAGANEGRLLRVESEQPGDEEGASKVSFIERYGLIHSDLTIGPNTGAAVPLRANEGLSATGVKLHGSGFLIAEEKARELGLGRIPGLEQHIRSYRHGRDITSRPRGLMVIDLDAIEIEDVRTRFPAVYQHVLTTVKPERDVNREPSRRQFWWRFGRRNTELRAALRGLRRYIATPETAKHRFFVFLDASILPDNKLVNIGSSDAQTLGVLSSRIHVAWALAAGGRLGVGNDPVYVKTACFEPFPFPEASEPQRERIRFLGEQLDAHRKRRQEANPNLTLTEMYNVLEELRAGETLSAASRVIHERGLISVLRDLHDDIDRAVAEAYGWPSDLSTEEILFHDPRLFYEEEYPIRESAHSGGPPSLFYYRIMQRGHSNLLDCIRHRLREPLRKFREDTFVPRQCFFQFCVRLRQPNNRKRHCLLSRSALTCSHGMTSEGFSSYLATR